MVEKGKVEDIFLIDEVRNLHMEDSYKSTEVFNLQMEDLYK